MGLYTERLQLLKDTIAHKETGIVPFMGAGNACNAQFFDVPLARYCDDMDVNSATNLKACLELGVDMTQDAFFPVKALTIYWYSSVLQPGIELSDNELWQITETERMTQDDYDLILEMGVEAWQEQFFDKNFPGLMEYLGPRFEFESEALRRFYEAGIPCVSGGVLASPMESFCGGRSLVPFLIDDLMEIPDKVDEVSRVFQDYTLKNAQELFENNKPLGVWIGGWRGTPSVMSPDMFERFSWQYMVELFDLCVQYDVIPLFHLDSNWGPGLHYFNQLTPNKGIVAFDGQTDIFRAKEVLGDTMCIMGDVPAEMLAFGTTTDVYDYCRKLIAEIGPTGYLMSSGCDIPFNAKLENVKMMRKALDDAGMAMVA